MPANTFYITTPIYYVNAEPHLGSSYTTLMCDFMRRYHDLLGDETYFLTGTDEHGEKIFREARAKGEDVREMVDRISLTFRNLWPQLNVSNDDFIRTTEERHIKVVREILQKTFDNDDIYKAEYGGNYCVGCERYYSDRDLNINPGEKAVCPIHEKELEYITETNYFFRLSKYQDWLRDKIENDPLFLEPKQYRNEVLAFLREPLEDLCISRPSERLHWGIPLPFNEGYVTYVWYDALLNYVSALGGPEGDLFKKFWPNSVHMTAKDILRQHAVYWPCMLKAAGLPIFKQLRVHGYWTVEGKKISKSLGNVIDPRDEIKSYGLDVYRYFLAREMNFGPDGDYSARALVGRNNAELANDLGNLLSRLTGMVKKYFDGKMPAATNLTEDDSTLLANLDALFESLPGYLDVCAIHAFLEKLMAAVASTNKYITDQVPWAKMKKGEVERVGTILAVASQMLVGAGQLLYPVMPGKMTELLAAFSLEPPKTFVRDAIKPGVEVVPAQPLFLQLEVQKEAEPEAEVAEEPVVPSVPPIKPEIVFEDFQKLDLRVGLVTEAVRVPKTDKLINLSIDLGVDKRQIVSGIAGHYEPADLVGKQVVLVANLAPRKMKGILSQGMVLTSCSGENIFVLQPEQESIPGSQVN